MKRTKLIRLHRQLGLAFAPLLFLQAVTGVMMLLREPLNQAFDPAGMTRQSTGTLPVSHLADQARHALPDDLLTRIYLPKSPTGTVMAQFGNAPVHMKFASIDPGSGRVLASGPLWCFPLETALQLHYRLMDGRVGMLIVLANGVVLMLIAGTGLAYWWPRRGHFGDALAKFPKVPIRGKLRHLHRSLGVTMSSLVLFSAVTGIMLAFPEATAPAAPAVADSSAALPTGPQIDEAIALAQQQFPESSMRDIRFRPTGRLDINFHESKVNPRAVHIVSVSTRAPEVISTVAAEDNPALWMQVLPLHTGESAGQTGTIFLLAEGLALAFLSVTGPIIWWRSRSKIRKD